jgi:hypothetical protein
MVIIELYSLFFWTNLSEIEVVVLKIIIFACIKAPSVICEVVLIVLPSFTFCNVLFCRSSRIRG